MLKSVVSGLVAGCLVMAAGPTAAATQPRRVPPQCLTMDISPYSTLEKLEVVKTDGKRLVFSVEIADTYAERQQGMMCRNHIPDTHGMLFQFPDVGPRAFWMQNTLIPLDIIYIAPNGRIVSIQKQAKPLDVTPLPSGAPASGVLEVRGGLSERLGLKPGDRVIHPFFR